MGRECARIWSACLLVSAPPPPPDRFPVFHFRLHSAGESETLASHSLLPPKSPQSATFSREPRATRREYATTAPPAAAHHPPPRAPLARPDLTSAAAANGVRRPADLPRHRQRPPVSEPTHPTIVSFDPAAACFYPCPFPIRPRGLHWWWCCARALCLALG